MNKEQLQEILESTQPYAVSPHSAITLDLRPTWNTNIDPDDVDAPVDAFVNTKQNKYQLTAGALLSLAGALQMGKNMLLASPAEHVEPLLNWWYKTIPDEDSPAFTISKNDVASAVVKATGELPQFPTHYLNKIVEALAFSTDGTDNSVIHPYVKSSTKETFFIVYTKNISTLAQDDVWYGGIAFKMSVSGNVIPTLSAVLVRPSDDAVLIPANLDYKYKASKHGRGVTNVDSWVEDSVGILCALLERELGVLNYLAKYDGSQHAGNIIDDILREVSLPRIVKSAVLESVENNDDTSGYGLLNDILSALDFSPESEYDGAINEKIMRAAGKLWAVLDNRCDECHQMFH